MKVIVADHKGVLWYTSAATGEEVLTNLSLYVDTEDARTLLLCCARDEIETIDDVSVVDDPDE